MHMKCVAVRCSKQWPLSPEEAYQENLIASLLRGVKKCVWLVNPKPLSVNKCVFVSVFSVSKEIGTDQRLTLENPPGTLVIEQS